MNQQSKEKKSKKKHQQPTFTKLDIAKQVFDQIGFSMKEASDYVDLTFDLLKELVCKHKRVKILKFGTFKVQERKSKIGRNPQTGEKVSIPSHRTLHFKSSLVLKELVHKKKDK